MDVSYFVSKNHLEEGSTQKYLVFQPIARYFKVITNTDYISSWEPKGLSAETIKSSTVSDNTLTPTYYDDPKVRVKFTGSCLKQPKFTYTHKTIVNINIAYELDASTSSDNDPALKNCLFGEVTLTKNAGIDKYGYSGYGIEFDRKSRVHFQVVGLVKMY